MLAGSSAGRSRLFQRRIRAMQEVNGIGRNGMTERGGDGDFTLSETMDWGKLSNSIGCIVRLLRNELTVRIMASLEPFGLHSGAHTTMQLISSNPGCAQRDLARELAIDESALVTIIDELEERGFAQRVRSKSDRRRNGLFLTPEGEAIKDAMFAQTLAVETAMYEEFSESESRQLLALLRRAYGALARTPTGKGS
jgi:DNA-binding MarR family transcriptional regulator